MKKLILIVALAAASSAGAQGSILNPENTFGKNQAAIQRMCSAESGLWTRGMCMLAGGTGVLFEWRNGRVYEHTIMKQDPDFGRRMIREFRKMRKEDTTAKAVGCKEWIWRNVAGRRYWVIICPSKNMSSASARKLR